MDKAITTTLLVIGSLIATVILMNAVLPALANGSNALEVANVRSVDRIKTDVVIVFATGNTSTAEFVLWAKNVGLTTVEDIEKSDIFLTSPTGVQRIPFGSSSGTPYWDHVIENDTTWTQTATIRITLHMASVSTGLHSVSIVVSNSTNAVMEFSV